MCADAVREQARPERDRDGLVRDGEFRVLALDGGGVRGALIAGYLKTVEERLKAAGKPGILDSVDLIVGTSTGSIVAALLAIGFDATGIADFYLKKGRYVFEAPYKQFAKWLITAIVFGVLAVVIRILRNGSLATWTGAVNIIPTKVLETLNFLNGKAGESLDTPSSWFIGGECWGLFLGGLVLAMVIQIIVYLRTRGFPMYMALFPKYLLGDLEKVMGDAISREKGALKLHPSFSAKPPTARDIPVDAASCRLVITTYNLVEDESLVVKTNHKGTSNTGKWKLINAVRSSSAAPFYFPPMRIEATELGSSMGKSQNGVICDGGVWANNPALVGFVEARKVISALETSNVNIKVLSIGTGVNKSQKAFKLPFIGFGALWWIGPFLGALWNGQARNVNYVMSKLMPGQDYLRINFRLEPRLCSLDNVGNFQDLVRTGERLAIAENRPGSNPYDEGFDWFK